MARQPRESVNTGIKLSPGVKEIALVMDRELSTRDLIILASLDQLIETGPVDFNSGMVCDLLNVKHPMINHYFGSRDGLLAEATVWAYRGWSYKLVTAVKNAPKDPEKRLRAFIDSELEWSERMRAIAVLIQYPLVSAAVRKIIDSEYSEEMQKYFEYHLALLTVIVVDLRKGKNSDLSFDSTNYPRSEFVLKYPKEIIDATSIAWAVHGLAQWKSGSHTATTNLGQEFASKLSEKVAIQNHINNIIALAKGK